MRWCVRTLITGCSAPSDHPGVQRLVGVVGLRDNAVLLQRHEHLAQLASVERGGAMVSGSARCCPPAGPDRRCAARRAAGPAAPDPAGSSGWTSAGAAWWRAARGPAARVVLAVDGHINVAAHGVGVDVLGLPADGDRGADPQRLLAGRGQDTHRRARRGPLADAEGPRAGAEAAVAGVVAKATTLMRARCVTAAGTVHRKRVSPAGASPGLMSS